MRTRWLSLFVLAAIILSYAGVTPQTLATPATQTSLEPGDCVEGEALSSGARTLYCQPDTGWNGSVVYFAHGYVPVDQPLDFYYLNLPDGTFLPELVQSLGYAFATTSYSVNGLAVIEGVAEMKELAARYPPEAGGQAYAVGLSMGGQIAALLAEQSPQPFDGVLAACGTVGSFRRQVDYWGDVRVLFDYFFPFQLPGSPISIPDELIANWESVYQPRVVDTLEQSPDRLRQLLITSKAPFDPTDGETAIQTVRNVLWYNVIATNDASMKLNGNPYDNRYRWYTGSNNDLALNLGRYRVQRFGAAPAALFTIARDYETAGKPNVPIVLPHTTSDEIVPFEQTIRYYLKAQPEGNGSVWPIPIDRYGHCDFTTNDLLRSFGLLVILSTGQSPTHLAALTDEELDLEATRAEFERQLQAFHAAEAAEVTGPAGSLLVYLPVVGQ